ncbi:DUF6119 family protein [Lentzea sp. NPDC006480]|uniref:DUF6119 family protein n=1 Tax=Lentzea sp. NPDC006480 TaxID=3157176 RepID=UPI0033AF1518
MADRPAKLRFNCYLLREGLDSPVEALRAQYRPDGRTAMVKLSVSTSAPSGVSAFASLRSEKSPTWATALVPFFPQLESVINTSSRLVIFLPVKNRTFAACFGYGSSALEWTDLEPNFGLRFAARRIDPNGLNEIRSRRIDASSRTQSVQLPAGSDIRNFDIPLEGEFVRKLAGELDSEGVSFGDIGAIVATDSVAFKMETDLTQVISALGHMLDEVSTRQVHDELAFVDALVPLRTKSTEVTKLDALLATRLFEGVRNGVTARVREDAADSLTDYFLEFSPPDGVSTNKVNKVVVRRGNTADSKRVDFTDLTIEGLRVALTELGGRFGKGSLKDIRLIAVDDNGEPASQMLPLKNWLVFEAGDTKRRFILTLGGWFSLQENYTDQLNKDLATIEVVNNEIPLPDWLSTDKEGEYNEKAAVDGFALLDKVDLRPEDGDEVEACDLFYKDGHLVHVKRYNGSQTLSHLFSQGFVSAQLIAGDATYRANFLNAIASISANLSTEAEAAPRTVTYAIGVTGDKKIPDDLPSFSKVNLRDFAKRLRLSKLRATLYRIQIIESSEDGPEPQEEDISQH